MNTDDLIDALSRNAAAPETPRPASRAALAVGLGLATAVSLLLVGWGLRPDLVAAMPAVLAKAGFSALLAGVAAPLAVRLAKPGRPLGWRLKAVLAAFALSLLVAAGALLVADPGARWQAWTGGGFPWCLAVIPALAAPIAAGLIAVMRALAPTRLELTGAAVGAVAGGLGAMVYALYCPVDSVAFVVTWYALAVALCAVIGALIGQKFLRW